MVNIKDITSEGRNKNTEKIDVVSTKEMMKLLNSEDKTVPIAIEKQIDAISEVVDKGTEIIKNGGRIIYIGAGTSGRLGVLDASEILPTFGEDSYFVGIIAGGDTALRTPIENAEDSSEMIISDLKRIKATDKDMIIGIAASGRTPYVLHGLKFGNSINAITVALSTSKNTIIGKEAKYKIEAVVGQEPITGSTRMKSGTAQKLILNMISTGVMVKLGKTYSNLMVDLKPTNEKLHERAVQMLMTITNINKEQALDTFEKAGNSVKVAVVMTWTNTSANESRDLIQKHNGRIREIHEQKQK